MKTCKLPSVAEKTLLPSSKQKKALKMLLKNKYAKKNLQATVSNWNSQLFQTNIFLNTLESAIPFNIRTVKACETCSIKHP